MPCGRQKVYLNWVNQIKECFLKLSNINSSKIKLIIHAKFVFWILLLEGNNKIIIYVIINYVWLKKKKKSSPTRHQNPWKRLPLFSELRQRWIMLVGKVLIVGPQKRDPSYFSLQKIKVLFILSIWLLLLVHSDLLLI